MNLKIRKDGFTLVELLAVLTIIAIVVALLVPAVSMVRTIARGTSQKAQITAIDFALIAYKGDFGDYPESDWDADGGMGYHYFGAQKLAEALVGWDLLGVHPDTEFIAKNHKNDGGKYDANDIANLKDREGPYLDASTSAFGVGKLFSDTKSVAPDTFVLCDSFMVKKITFDNGETVKAGTPILYYKANTSSKTMVGVVEKDRIYNKLDNNNFVELYSLVGNIPHPLHDLQKDNFYSRDYKIIDPKITSRDWPHRPDSYILISAGVDGLYGTSDDITNF